MLDSLGLGLVELECTAHSIGPTTKRRQSILGLGASSVFSSGALGAVLVLVCWKRVLGNRVYHFFFEAPRSGTSHAIRRRGCGGVIHEYH
jgi:hypothetical protein